MSRVAAHVRGARLTIGAALIGIGLTAGVGHAAADPVDLAVVDRETDQVAEVWRHAGRAYVAGEPGHRYGLRVTNHTGRRVLVVLSVDGVNVMDGETASYRQGGYVLAPYQSIDVNGWRKSTSEVAAFGFASLSQSYAAQTGRPGDVGVIGMAVFNERVRPPPTPTPMIDPAPRASGFAERGGIAPPPPLGLSPAPPAPPAPTPPVMAPPAPALQARTSTGRGLASAPKAAMADGASDEKLGTAHGEREASFVIMTTFVRATTRPAIVREIEYDTRAHLIASGVIPRPGWLEHPPRAFPSGRDEPGFTPDPPGDD